MSAKQFELEVLSNKYVIAEFDRDNYYLDDENSAKSLECRLNELHEENKRLKKENSEYHKIVNCSNCHFHNYDWYDDGDEFEVCDKGNDERLMYHQFCKDWVEL